MEIVKPFVKWAGGKRSIVDKLIKYSPSEYKKLRTTTQENSDGDSI